VLKRDVGAQVGFQYSKKKASSLIGKKQLGLKTEIGEDLQIFGYQNRGWFYGELIKYLLYINKNGVILN
jgi:hypothetical protein